MTTERQKEYYRNYYAEHKEKIQTAVRQYLAKRRNAVREMKKLMQSNGIDSEKPQELTANQKRYLRRRDKAIAYARAHPKTKEQARKASRKASEKERTWYELAKHHNLV